MFARAARVWIQKQQRTHTYDFTQNQKRSHPQGPIDGYRVYLFPNQEKTALLLFFQIAFPNNKNLNRLTEALKNHPYNCSYETIAEAPALYLRIIVPAFEWINIKKEFRQLAEREYIKDVHMLLDDLAHGTWDNLEIHQMLKDGAWNFSCETATNARRLFAQEIWTP